MKASFDSTSNPTAEVTITAEVGIFRAEIAQWAARYLSRRNSHDTSDGFGKATENLRSWSHEYFRTTKVTEARGVYP